MSVENLKQEAISSNSSPQRLKEIAAISCELASLVASNPNANSQLLNELAVQARNNRDLETQRAIALNPNTSKKLLVELACKFPKEFFANPTYDLSILDEVNFTHLFARKLLLKLACTANASTSFLSFAADISQNNIEKITNDRYYPHLTLEQQYQNRFNNKLGIVEYYPFNYFWKWREILIAIASHKNTSREKLDELSAYKEPVVAKIAKIRLKYCIHQKEKNSNNICFWSEVALHKDPNLTYFIANELIYKLVKLPNISSVFLAAVSKCKTARGSLKIVVNHPKATKHILNNLILDKNL